MMRLNPSPKRIVKAELLRGFENRYIFCSLQSSHATLIDVAPRLYSYGAFVAKLRIDYCIGLREMVSTDSDLMDVLSNRGGPTFRWRRQVAGTFPGHVEETAG